MIAAIILGGLGYTAVVLDVFGKKEASIGTTKKQVATPSAPKTNQKNSSPSEEISIKFKAVLTDECLDVLTKLDTGIKDYEKRQNLTKEEAEELQEAQQLLVSIEGKTLQEKADKLTAEVVSRWGGAFVVSNTDAEKFLAGEYNDAENRSLVKNYISEFAKRNVPLPYLLTILVGKYQSGEMNSGPLLEVTKRLFGEYLKEIS